MLTDTNSAIPKSVLRRPNHAHPFAAFIADDLAAIERLFATGFDPSWRGEHGVTCVMEAATRGNSASVHLALSLSKDAAALAALKSDAGLDAFDMAAASGAVSCMWELAKHLPAAHRSSIGRGFMWHAVQAHDANPALADGWLAHLCLGASRIPPIDMAQALMLARELGVQSAIFRLEALLAKGKT